MGVSESKIPKVGETCVQYVERQTGKGFFVQPFVDCLAGWTEGLVMDEKNITSILLLGFQLPQNLTFLAFWIFFVMSGVTIFGNLLIITVVSYSKSLHCPMYFFLSQLSVLDTLLEIDILPSMLHTLLAEKVIILFSACFTQLYFFELSAAAEMLLLTVMSYDRYLAICKPLHYTLIMTHQVCWRMVITCWILSIITALNNILTVLKLQFCSSNVIDHFFCDFEALLELPCSDTTMVQFELKSIGAVFIVTPFLIIIVSYIFIVATIFEIPSITGRKKVFSTCSSHLTVVSIFYGTLISVYLVPRRGQLRYIAKFLSLLYAVVTPMMNPIIYSLRNKDLKVAIEKLITDGYRLTYNWVMLKQTSAISYMSILRENTMQIAFWCSLSTIISPTVLGSLSRSRRFSSDQGLPNVVHRVPLYFLELYQVPAGSYLWVVSHQFYPRVLRYSISRNQRKEMKNIRPKQNLVVIVIGQFL
ncbi:olfactory receptor 1468-like [Gastrophryne carolinensis]